MAEPERGAEAVPEAANDASRGQRSRTGGAGAAITRRAAASGPSGWVLLALAAAAVGLLVAAEFSTISYRSIGIGACSTRENPGICATPAHAQHGYALVILALVAVLMGWGAIVGRSRAAAVAMIVIGATVLGIALLGDYPKRDERRGLNARYTGVKGHLGPAFKTELAGAALLVLAGGLALARPRAPEPRSRRRREREVTATTGT